MTKFEFRLIKAGLWHCATMIDLFDGVGDKEVVVVFYLP